MPETAFVDTSQPIEQKSNWPKIILAAVLGLGLLAVSAYAGYYYGTQQVQQSEKPTPVVSQPTPRPTPTPEPTPTPTSVVEDQVTGWKIYTNTKYGYSVSVPQDAVVVEENKTRDTATEGTILQSTVYEVDESGCRGGCTFPVTKGWSFEVRTQRGWTVGFDKEFFKKSLPIMLPGILFEEERVVDGVVMLITEGPRPDLPDLGNTNYFADFVKDEKWYRVTYTNAKSQESLRKEIFYQILSTFKFLD